MNTYTATIKNMFGGYTSVVISAYSLTEAQSIAQAQYGDKVLYVQI